MISTSLSTYESVTRGRMVLAHVTLDSSSIMLHLRQDEALKLARDIHDTIEDADKKEEENVQD